MSGAMATSRAGPLRKLDAAAIEKRPTRHYRAAVFQSYVWIASGVFVALAVVARGVPYFPVDLAVTRTIQQTHSVPFDRLMYALSWLGFVPQVDVLGILGVGALYLAGLHWEAVCALFAAAGVGVGTAVKIAVFRPRPSADLVHVLKQLPTRSFPSGHVLEFTCFCGFLAFLAYTLLKPSGWRNALTAVLASIVVLMGVSRIYEGQHWFSDVMGAYLLGSLWLALTIKLYRWGKPRFFVRQPVASEAPAPQPPGSRA